MPRLTGARNQTYDAKRRMLLQRLRQRLGQVGAMHASWRDLAAAAGVSLSTMAHYFGRREDIVRAVLDDAHQGGSEPLAVMAMPLAGFRVSVEAALSHLAGGLTHGGVDTLFVIGLAEGLRNPVIGPCFVAHSLEPTIAAVAARLAAHQARGEMRPDCDPRAAALGLISPLILAHLHQHDLSGATAHPLDMSAFIAQQAEAFVRGHAAEEVRR
jgi:AcrR family transcriptional regulator